MARRQQALFLHGHGGAKAAVGVDDAVGIRDTHMNGAVDDKPSRVGRVIALANHIAFVIDFNQ